MVVLTASEAASIRLGMQQPTGVAERRQIGADVVKNIMSIAPKCEAQGSISAAALAYLLGWCQCTLPKLARPTAYSCLRFRQNTPNSFTRNAIQPKWRVPARAKVFDLKLSLGDGSDSDDDDDGLEILRLD